ncbi:hypothetical protein IQ255_07710 [Pleurocapsales cyanobacterium LEGE 10410]|nr:hypothetical protein [Pleurocapsales cyanobacterium LEGE 10410]
MNTTNDIVHNPDLAMFLDWKQRVRSGRIPISYQPMLNEVTTYFNDIDKLSDEAKLEEPVDRNTSRQLKRLRESLRTSIQTLSALLRLVETLVGSEQKQQELWDSIEQIEELGIVLQGDYSGILNLAIFYQVTTYDLRRDFDLFESALLIRDEILSLQSLPDHHGDHLRWRQVSVISFYNSAQKVIRDIEAAHRKSWWRTLVESVVGGKKK